MVVAGELDRTVALLASLPYHFVLRSGLTPAQALEQGEMLAAIRGRSNFWIGDYLIQFEGRYGEMYAQAVDIFKLHPNRLANIKSTALEFGVEARARFMNPQLVGDQGFTRPLSYSHFEAVRSVPKPYDEVVLEQAARGDWGSSSTEFRTARDLMIAWCEERGITKKKSSLSIEELRAEHPEKMFDLRVVRGRRVGRVSEMLDMPEVAKAVASGRVRPGDRVEVEVNVFFMEAE